MDGAWVEKSFVFLLIVTALSACAPDVTATAAPDQVAREVIELVNQERVSAGLQPLVVNEELMVLAQQRSADMAEGDYVSHWAPTGHPQLHELTQELGYDLLETPVENIVHVMTTDLDGVAPRAVDAWRDSPGHWRWTMSEGLSMTGVGVSVGDDGVVVTQLFWGPGVFTPATAHWHNESH